MLGVVSGVGWDKISPPHGEKSTGGEERRGREGERKRGEEERIRTRGEDVACGRSRNRDNEGEGRGLLIGNQRILNSVMQVSGSERFGRSEEF